MDFDPFIKSQIALRNSGPYAMTLITFSREKKRQRNPRALPCGYETSSRSLPDTPAEFNSGERESWFSLISTLYINLIFHITLSICINLSVHTFQSEHLHLSFYINLSIYTNSMNLGRFDHEEMKIVSRRRVVCQIDVKPLH